jgi:hypothetical protein
MSDTLRDSFSQIHINLQVILMTDFDCHAATELDLYARNFSGVHYNSVGKCLSKFHQRGDFNYERAVKYIERNLVMPAAKDYLLCFGSMTQSLRNTFPKSMRLFVSEQLANSFRAEFELGNYWA